MGRKATGTIYEKDGALWFAFLLRSKKRYAQKVPPHPEGRPATRPEARTYLDEARRRYDLGLWDPEAPAPAQPPAAAAPGPLTVIEYARRWAKALPHDTAEQEQHQVDNHVATHAIGAMALTEVAPRDVAAWVKELRQKPSNRGGTLAASTVRGIVALLSKMFVAAQFDELVKSNPVAVLPKGVVPPLTDKDPSARQGWRYTREEAVSLISDMRIPPDRRALYTLLFLAGLRIGEAVVLRWRDWDPSRRPLGCITVARALASRDRSRVKKTKTGAVREVPVHATLAAVLGEWKLRGWGQHTNAGRAPEGDDVLAPSRTGQRRHPRNVHRQLAADCKALGIRPRRVHGTRHTFISMAIDDGARFDVVQRITHTRPVRSAFDQYRSEAWPTLCAEVAKIRLARASELSLWRAVGADDSATDSATRGSGPQANASVEGGSNSLPAPARFPGTVSGAAETQRNEADASKEPGEIAGGSDAMGSDSATGSATVGGPLVGELWAYEWGDRALLAAGLQGVVPDVMDLG